MAGAGLMTTSRQGMPGAGLAAPVGRAWQEWEQQQVGWACDKAREHDRISSGEHSQAALCACLPLGMPTLALNRGEGGAPPARGFW